MAAPEAKKYDSTLFTRFVEVGRVAYITFGPDLDRRAIIVDIIDHRRVIVDCPQEGLRRQAIPIRRLRLTRRVIEIPRGCSTEALAQVELPPPSKMVEAKKFRQSLNDFERFKLNRAVRTRDYLAHVKLGHERKGPVRAKAT